MPLAKAQARVEVGMPEDEAVRVLLRGGGDLATGVAVRLFESGFFVAVLELPQPLAIRRTVALASAVADGRFRVEGVEARLVDQLPQKPVGFIPLKIDPDGESLRLWRPSILVDARMAKLNLGTRITDAPWVIGMGPGFEAGADVHCVIETQRGHDLGRVVRSGSASADTKIPGELGGESAQRVLRAPCSGKFEPVRQIGEQVAAGEVVARVNGEDVVTKISGLLRGSIAAGVEVPAGLKIGDVDPRGGVGVVTISDKARSLGGAVLEAILSSGLWRVVPVGGVRKNGRAGEPFANEVPR